MGRVLLSHCAVWTPAPSAPPVPRWLRCRFLIQVDLQNVVQSSQQKRGWSYRRVPLSRDGEKEKNIASAHACDFVNFCPALAKPPRSIRDHDGMVMWIKSWNCCRHRVSTEAFSCHSARRTCEAPPTRFRTTLSALPVQRAMKQFVQSTLSWKQMGEKKIYIAVGVCTCYAVLHSQETACRLIEWVSWHACMLSLQDICLFTVTIFINSTATAAITLTRWYKKTNTQTNIVEHLCCLSILKLITKKTNKSTNKQQLSSFININMLKYPLTGQPRIITVHIVATLI